MKQVHMTLQGKGGVGKSLVSSLLVQYLRARERAVSVIDTDPVNATLLGYRSFEARRLELLEGGSVIERRFDTLIERVLAEDTDFVIDNGASSFIPLSYYLAENEAISVLAGSGKEVVLHTVITGGQALRDTLAGLDSLVKQMPPEARIIVWLNQFFGEIVADGKTFEEMQVYRTHRDRILGIVTIERRTGSTFGQDMQLMLDKKMTFAEITASSEFGLMAKSRLGRVQREIFEQLDAVL